MLDVDLTTEFRERYDFARALRLVEYRDELDELWSRGGAVDGYRIRSMVSIAETEVIKRVAIAWSAFEGAYDAVCRGTGVTLERGLVAQMMTALLEADHRQIVDEFSKISPTYAWAPSIFVGVHGQWTLWRDHIPGRINTFLQAAEKHEPLVQGEAVMADLQRRILEYLSTHVADDLGSAAARTAIGSPTATDLANALWHLYSDGAIRGSNAVANFETRIKHGNAAPTDITQKGRERLESGGTAIMPSLAGATFNFNNSQAMFGSGPGARQQMTVNITAADQGKLVQAIVGLIAALQSQPVGPNQDKLIRYAKDVHDEVLKPAPNGSTLMSLLTVIGTGVQSIAAAQPAYDAVMTMVRGFGIG